MVTYNQLNGTIDCSLARLSYMQFETMRSEVPRYDEVERTSTYFSVLQLFATCYSLFIVSHTRFSNWW